MNKRSFGHIGENSAAIYLEGLGFEIVAKNFYVGKFEIDLIAKNSDLLVFAEVKTRRQYPDRHSPYGRPAAAVNYTKRKNMIDAALRYIHENKEFCLELQPRLDIIEVYVDPDDVAYRVLEIKHFPNAVHR
ncbi:MAG: YraN family protein [Clostridia bacterium]|nr:YraN family protein [Clostridia bacterium]